MCANLGPRSEGKEIYAVSSREICNGYDLPLAPKDIVGECRNVGHVNAGADNASAFSHRAKGRRHQRADRRVDDRGIQLGRRAILRSAGPGRAERKRQLLRLPIAVTGKGVD